MFNYRWQNVYVIHEERFEGEASHHKQMNSSASMESNPKAVKLSYFLVHAGEC